MRHLPFSPSRTQALIEFEPVLLELFQSLTTQVNSEVRDAMHYAIFSEKDRFCLSSAWLIATRLKVSAERFSTPACAIETLRCSLAFKTRAGLKLKTSGDKLLEPAIAEAAAYGLIPLAFEMILVPNNPLSVSEKTSLATTLAQAASPIHVLSALHREDKILREGYRHGISWSELQNLHQEKVTPAFHAVGEVLELLSGMKTGSRTGQLSLWFKRLGLFTYWVDEFTSANPSPLALNQVMAAPNAMDLMKSLEGELFERARELDLQGAAHEIIEPVADMLKIQLQ